MERPKITSSTWHELSPKELVHIAYLLLTEASVKTDRVLPRTKRLITILAWDVQKLEGEV